MHQKYEKIMRLRCEEAFRRGYSHGFLTGRDLKNGLTEKDVLKWRYNPDKRNIGPPGKLFLKSVGNCLK